MTIPVDWVMESLRETWRGTYRMFSFVWKGEPEWSLSPQVHVLRRRALLLGGAPLRVKR